MQFWRREAGLTLIETSISLMIFSVGMLGLSGLTTIIIHGNSLSQKITLATILAQDKLEAVQNTAYDELASEKETITTDHRRYTRVMDVHDNTPMQGMKIVSIAVYWAQNDSTKHHVSLQTIMTDDRK
jgi:Tfp pilus assembly protein PilV